MTPEYRIDAERRITEYLQSQNLENIKNIQVKQTFEDLGFEVNIWNIRTKNDGNWWVAEGENVPMNLYTQNEYFFSADEAYSFHLGITQRLQARHQNDYKHVIDELPLDIDMLQSINRKLNASAIALNNINAPEDIQSIGLTCRESMVELAGYLYKSHEDILKKKALKLLTSRVFVVLSLDYMQQGRGIQVLGNIVAQRLNLHGIYLRRQCILQIKISQMLKFVFCLHVQQFH